jgi:hypothetical protein
MAVPRVPHPGYFGKRGCKLLKTKGGRAEKRAKRVTRGCNLLITKELQEKAGQMAQSSERRDHGGVYTPGVLDRCEKKGFARQESGG